MKAGPEPAAAPILSVQQAEAQLAAARAELAQLAQRAAGSIEHRTTRREQHTVIRQTGRAEVVDMDVPHTELEHVGPLGRLRARRALADAEDRVALARRAARGGSGGGHERRPDAADRNYRAGRARGAG